MQASELSAFSTRISRQFDAGLEVCTHVNGLYLYVCFYLSEVNVDALPSIMPEERFQDDRTIHVGELNNDSIITTEIESILANMNSNDTALFFCADQQTILKALSFLNFHGEIR